MQNRYTGDIGDYGKYALLKTLAGSDLRLAVVWYLNPHEEGSADGKFTEYLSEAREGWYRPADPGVYDILKKIVRDDRRRVSSVREKRILPVETIFYEAPLDYAKFRPAKDRQRAREDWSKGAFNNTREAKLVFFDPDNGLEVKSHGPHTKLGAKYAFETEIQPFLDRDQSIVVYQHLNRSGRADDQTQKRIAKLGALAKRDEGWAISFHAFSTRTYLILASEKHSSLLRQRCDEFVRDPNKLRAFKLRAHAL
jgi:hypothetical protein